MLNRRSPISNGRKTEVDFIFRPFLDKARELGLSVPTITAVYRIAKAIDELVPA